MARLAECLANYTFLIFCLWNTNHTNFVLNLNISICTFQPGWGHCCSQVGRSSSMHPVQLRSTSESHSRFHMGALLFTQYWHSKIASHASLSYDRYLNKSTTVCNYCAGIGWPGTGRAKDSGAPFFPYIFKWYSCMDLTWFKIRSLGPGGTFTSAKALQKANHQKLDVRVTFVTVGKLVLCKVFEHCTRSNNDTQV